VTEAAGAHATGSQDQDRREAELEPAHQRIHGRKAPCNERKSNASARATNTAIHGRLTGVRAASVPRSK
jgi:hypothetical protein